MATLRKKREPAAVSGERQEQPRNSQAQERFVPGITEVYITQILRRLKVVSIKLSREFSRTESRNFGAVLNLYEVLWNPQVRTLSGNTPGTSRNNGVENRETAGDRSQNDPYSEVKFFGCMSNNSNDSDPEDTSHM